MRPGPHAWCFSSATDAACASVQCGIWVPAAARTVGTSPPWSPRTLPVFALLYGPRACARLASQPPQCARSYTHGLPHSQPVLRAPQCAAVRGGLSPLQHFQCARRRRGRRQTILCCKPRGADGLKKCWYRTTLTAAFPGWGCCTAGPRVCERAGRHAASPHRQSGRPRRKREHSRAIPPAREAGARVRVILRVDSIESRVLVCDASEAVHFLSGDVVSKLKKIFQT